MSTTTLPSPSISLEREHHHHSTPSPLPTTTSQTTQVPVYKPSDHLDRNCAIALGLIAFLVILASPFLLQRCIKRLKQADLERRDIFRQRDISPITPDPTLSFRTASIWSSRSAYMSESNAGEKKERRRESRVDSAATTIVGSIYEEAENTGSRSPSPSPHSRTRTPSASSKRSRHRRTSSVQSIPAAYLAEPRRLSSSSQCEGMRHGSMARRDRRFSSLETIHEPEAAGLGSCQGGVRGKVGRYEWTRPESVVHENLNHSSVTSSKYEKEGYMPQCTVPGVLPECFSSDEESGHDTFGLGDFRGVSWTSDCRSDKTRSAMDEGLGPAPDERDAEGVHRLDWAKQPTYDGRRQTIW